MGDRSDGGAVIAFAPIHDSPGKHDAKWFQRKASEFVEAAGGGTVVHFDNHARMLARAATVLGAIDETVPTIVCCAFFCHGWSRGMQAGFDLRKAQGAHPDTLAAALARRAGNGVMVPLYACSTAAEPPGGTHSRSLDAPGGDGGFADQLRDACAKHGLTRVRIDAHDRLGDTVANPYVRRFEGDGTTAPGYGGQWIVQPSSPLWPAWVAALKGPLALHYPWLSTEAIRRELEPANH